jgi:hypothetical protein
MLEFSLASSERTMQLPNKPNKFQYFAHFAGLTAGCTVLLAAFGLPGISSVVQPAGSANALSASVADQSTVKQSIAKQSIAKQSIAKQPLTSEATPRQKTSVEGEFVGPATDCDGDGLADDSQIDFNNDGVPDNCVEGREDIPEPPFEQTFLPSQDNFYAALPPVGWNARYQCGETATEIFLRRPSEDKMEYIGEGLVLTSDIVYDDIDANLNQPLLIQDPTSGVRYSFQRESNGEIYEYAIANYGGTVGLYVYQTGQQIVAVPCISE